MAFIIYADESHFCFCLLRSFFNEASLKVYTAFRAFAQFYIDRLANLKYASPAVSTSCRYYFLQGFEAFRGIINYQLN